MIFLDHTRIFFDVLWNLKFLPFYINFVIFDRYDFFDQYRFITPIRVFDFSFVLGLDGDKNWAI